MTSGAALPEFDVYAELGVPRDATASQIRSAYRRRAKECHPDVAANKAGADGRMKRLNQAHDVLRNPARRADYDRTHRTPGAGSPTGSDRSRSTSGTNTSGPQAERARQERAEQERRRREAEQRRRRAEAAAARAAREAAERAERERREREAAERAERERRARERAAQAARERRARAAADRAARRERAAQLPVALLQDDTALLAQIISDGVVDWSRQRPSARAQAERAAERIAVTEDLVEAVRSGDASRVRSTRRAAALSGVDLPPDLRARSRAVYRTVPVPPAHRPRAAGTASTRAHVDADERTSTPPTPQHTGEAAFKSTEAELRRQYTACAWPDAARAWMAMRAQWADRVTPEAQAIGEEAVERWGALLRREEGL